MQVDQEETRQFLESCAIRSDTSIEEQNSKPIVKRKQSSMTDIQSDTQMEQQGSTHREIFKKTISYRKEKFTVTNHKTYQTVKSTATKSTIVLGSFNSIVQLGDYWVNTFDPTYKEGEWKLVRQKSQEQNSEQPQFQRAERCCIADQIAVAAGIKSQCRCINKRNHLMQIQEMEAFCKAIDSGQSKDQSHWQIKGQSTEYFKDRYMKTQED